MTTELIASLYEIKWRAIQIKPYLDGHDERWADLASKTYEDLVNRLHSLCSDYIVEEQVTTAMGDFDYFMVLIALAEAYFKGDDAEETRDRDPQEDP